MPENQPPRTEISELGEFGLIERLAKPAKTRRPSTLAGIGDDAAVLDGGGERRTLVSTDMLVEGFHFDLAYTPLKHLGYKAVTVNLSDIAAMNGVPEQILLSLALSNRFSVEAVEEFYKGVYLACEQYDVDLVGGDTTGSPAGLTVSVTAIGYAKPEAVVKRDGARKGDILCLTGDVGAAYVGLQLLRREKNVYLANPDMQPKLEGKDYVVGKQLKPEARTDIVHDLAEAGVVPTAMIDVSDGLASELFHICTQSRLGAVIYEDKIPVERSAYETAATEFKIDPVTAMLNGGEDYELLFSIKQDDYEKLEKHPDISFVGFMAAQEEGVKLVTRGGNAVDVKAQGWEHFGKENE